jgi:hypothetical protein
MLMCKLMQQADLGCFIQVVWPQNAQNYPGIFPDLEISSIY